MAAEGLGARPYDGHGQEEAAPRIEWKESWEATYKANVARWQGEVARLTADPREREKLVRMRAVRLLEALIARYPADTTKRLEALKEIAGNYYSCGLVSRGNHALVRLIEERPGDTELVLGALHRILRESRWESPWEIEDGMDWVDYAAPRLVALCRAAQVPEGHLAAVTALRALAVLRRAQGRLLEAAEALAALETHTGRDDPWLLEEAELYLAAGRDHEALPRFQDLHGRSEQNWRARDFVGLLLGGSFANPPSYACHFGLETAWDAIREAPVADVADRIARALKEDAEGRNLLPWREARHASLWVLLDHHLSAQPPAALAALRETQEAEARRQPRQGDAMLAFRRHPWAPTAHRALLAFGEDELRRGHAALALRAFQDVLSHSVDNDARARAQAGLRLAQAGLGPAQGGLGLSQGSLAPAQAGRGPAQAGDGRAALDIARPAPGGPPAFSLAAAERRLLRMLPVRPWQSELFDDTPRELTEAISPLLVRPQAHARGTLVAGPEVIACFGEDPSRPLWTRSATGSGGRHGRLEMADSYVLVVPGPFQPAIADGRVFSRWGLEETRRFLTDVAALDLATGEMLWCTAGASSTSAGAGAAWGDLWPIGDPVVADGRVYVLAVRKGYTGVIPVTTVSLVCLDAREGSVLWKRPLASQNVALMPDQRCPYRDYQFDLAHYGNAVAVDRGAVYCQSNMGFVARCDARDGVVEWVHTYTRVPLRWNVARVVRRQGAAPLVCGDRVVFLPRDSSGAFALDAATGKLVWDNPFAPSDELVGALVAPPSDDLPRGTGLVLVADRTTLAALDAATGRAAWRRHFPEGLRGRPCLAGTALCVGTPAGLHLLDAATGRELEAAADWGPGGPMDAFAISGRAIVGVTEQSVGSDREAPGTPLNPHPPSTQGPLRLPLTRCWKLARSNPTLWVPPPEAKLDGRLLVLSEGVLECVRATPQGGVDWQRGLAPCHIGTEWLDGMLLVVYPTSVAAIDTATGRLRWHTQAPFPIRQWQEAGPYLVLGAFTESERGRRTCALELASGKLLWHRGFSELGEAYGSYFHGIGWDGRAIHLLASLEQRAGGGHFDVLCQPTDGAILAVRRFLPKGRQWPFIFDVGEGSGFYVDQDKAAYEFTLDGPGPSQAEASPHKRYAADLRDLNPQTTAQLRRVRTRRSLQHAEQWLLLHQYEDYPLFRHIQWVFQRGNPAYELRRARPGIVRGNQLYEADDQTLRVVDLPSRKEVAQFTVELPPLQWGRILDFHDEGDAVLVVSGIERGPYASYVAPYRVRLDAFEKATGRLVASQLLSDLPYWKFAVRRDWRDHTRYRTQVAWGNGAMFITDAEGLSAFVTAAGPEGLPDKAVHIAHRVAKPPTLDGSLDDWPSGGEERKPGGSVRLAHDDARLYLAVTYTTASARARNGRGAYAGGGRLEVAISTGAAARHWSIGADARSRIAWTAPTGDVTFGTRENHDGDGSTTVPKDARAAFRHDPLAGEATYELTVPLSELVRRQGNDGGWRRIGVCVAAWEESPGPGASGGRDSSPRRVFAWGNGWWASKVVPELQEAVYLHPLTREGEEAGLAIAHAMPELDEGWDFFRKSCQLRAATRPSKVIADLYLDYLKRHPSGLPAERALVALDQALRADLASDPAPTVLRIAQEAGVAEPLRARYARAAKSHLSQWLHLDPKKRPVALMLQLHDGVDVRGWDHRVLWGVDHWRDWGTPGTPAHQCAGAIPRADGWQELRIPLIWLDLHDTPICGISFVQHGGGRVVWDRSAVVWDGGERVFLDDEAPKARETTGQWAWVGEPRHSGAKAHTEANPASDYNAYHHSILGMEAPVFEHIIPPAAGAVLSQWVFLDPANAPRTIALSLQSRGEPFRLHWGLPLEEGRYMGPLPKPGQWHELRVPLAWTPAHCWPIRGIVFEQIGGRVYWDRTALVHEGKEHVVIEDEMPQGSERGDWVWVDAPVKSGKRAHTNPPPERYGAHGVTYLREAFTQHMPFDPSRLAHLLEEQIPKMGPSEPAWRFFEVLRQTPPYVDRRHIDRIRWFLSVLPEHPRAGDLLKALLSYYKAMKEPDPLAAVEKVMEESNIPRAVREALRREQGAAQSK